MWTIQALTAFINENGKKNYFFFFPLLVDSLVCSGKSRWCQESRNNFGAHFVLIMGSTTWKVWISCYDFYLISWNHNFFRMYKSVQCTSLHWLFIIIHAIYFIKDFTWWNWMHCSPVQTVRIELSNYFYNPFNKSFPIETVRWILICFTFVLSNEFTFIKCLKCE